METNADERAVLLGRYIVMHNSTVRAAANANCISKSTVHSDVTKKLRRIDGELYLNVREILKKNKEERHIRGGMATKEKYRQRTAADNKPE